jgi:hypothetical protein
MNPIDLVYLDSIGSMLDQLAAEKAAAAASGAKERAGELQCKIEELSARRQQVARLLFGVVPAAAN